MLSIRDYASTIDGFATQRNPKGSAKPALARLWRGVFFSVSVRVAIIGGGIVGLATAHQLLERFPGVKVLLLEKESGPGRHQTGHNSGVLHCGLYYKPGTTKARLAVEGIRRMVAFCEQHGVPYELCGKTVVATEPEEIPRLHALLERGTANGVKGLKLLGPEQIREFEPHAAGMAGIRVPEEGIVDYGAVCEEMVKEIGERGGEVQVLVGGDAAGAARDVDDPHERRGLRGGFPDQLRRIALRQGRPARGQPR